MSMEEIGLWIMGGLAISGVASQLAALTPWGWDDKATGKIHTGFKILAGNWGKAKSQPKPNDNPQG